MDCMIKWESVPITSLSASVCNTLFLTLRLTCLKAFKQDHLYLYRDMVKSIGGFQLAWMCQTHHCHIFLETPSIELAPF